MASCQNFILYAPVKPHLLHHGGVLIKFSFHHAFYFSHFIFIFWLTMTLFGFSLTLEPLHDAYSEVQLPCWCQCLLTLRKFTSTQLQASAVYIYLTLRFYKYIVQIRLGISVLSVMIKITSLFHNYEYFSIFKKFFSSRIFPYHHFRWIVFVVSHITRQVSISHN